MNYQIQCKLCAYTTKVNGMPRARIAALKHLQESHPSVRSHLIDYRDKIRDLYSLYIELLNGSIEILSPRKKKE